MATFSGASYEAIRTVDVFRERVEALIEADLPFGFDIESSYVGDYIEDKQLLTYHPEWKLVGFSFTNDMTWARYVPVAHLTGENIDNPTECARLLWRLLQTGNTVAHNAQFELNGTGRWFRDMLWDDPEVGEQVRASDGFFPILADTMVQAQIIAKYPPMGTASMDGSLGIGTGLKALTKKVFGHAQVEFDSLFLTPKGKKAGPKDRKFDVLPVSGKHISYASEDAVFTLGLYYEHLPDTSEFEFIWKTEMMLMPVLVRMEKEGIYLDWEEIDRKATEVGQFRDLMEEEILLDLSDRLGRPIAINLGSPMQLRKVLYDAKPEGLGLEPKGFTATGAAATDEKALRVMAKSDSTLKRLLEFREVAKLYGSYLNKYRTQLHYDPADRAHAQHKQVGALTGRMSVDRVSYQQWPKPYHYELADGTTFDLNFRDLLIAPPGTRIVGYDYSQVELRVLAGMAEETAMLHAFNSGVDIHKATAAAMMKIPVESVTKKQRAVGKTLNFAVVYGSGAANIADMLTTPDAPVTKEDAEGYLRDYFNGFPKLRAWMSKMQAEGGESHNVYTPFGRKYHLWEKDSPNAFIRSKADRMAVNAPVQGGAADYMKIAMVRANHVIQKAGMGDRIKLVMTIHDALEFYVDNSVSTQEVLDLLNPAVSYRTKYMPNAPEIRADWHEGHSWGSVVEVKTDDAKQITGYQIEDDDNVFATFAEADAYLAKKVGKTSKAVPEISDAKVEEDFAAMTIESIEIPEPVITVHITLPTQPTTEQWHRFTAWRAEHPGKNTVVVHAPVGEVTLPETYAITHHHAGNLSLIFPGAEVTVDDPSMSL